MRILQPEANLAGFLSAVYHAYYTYPDAAKISSDPEAVTLLDEAVWVETDLELAHKVRKGILKSGGQDAYYHTSVSYLSNDPEKEQTLFLFLKLLFHNGRKTLEMHGDQTVIKVERMVQRVAHETHRLEGFIRLQEMENGIFYGGFTSDNDVIERLVPHFSDRYNAMRFVLHDIRRGKMILYENGNIHFMLAPPAFSILLSEDEVKFRALYKQYFKSVTVESRKNPRLQRHWMPHKYRHFMLELA